MPRTVTFKVSKRGQDPIEVSRELPESLDDDLWNEIVAAPEEDINELALQNWIVKCQSGARQRLESGPEAVQAYVNGYQYGARAGGFTAPTVSADEAKKQKFSKEQLEFLRKAGVAVEA